MRPRHDAAMIDVELVAHGRPSISALSDAVGRAKADDSLAKVTVLVPSNLAGLSARRLLGSGVLGGRGIANVDFVTPFRLSELLAPVRNPGRKPLTNPVLAAAVRHVLATDPGRFAPVAHHEATEAALVDLYEELSHALAETRRRIAETSRHGASLIEIHDRIAASLAGHEGEDDLVNMAAAHVEDMTDLATTVGAFVWWLPEPVSPAIGALVRSLSTRVHTTVVVGVTGDVDSDHLVTATVEAIGIDPPVTGDRPAAPVADRILSVSDADEEVRAVVREVLDLLAGGVPLHRIGVFHPKPDPYARTLIEQLTAASIAHNGPSRRRLADLTAGRVLLTAIEVADRDLARPAVMELCATGPLRDEEGFVPQGHWERLSRAAGVVGGLADWHTKLGAFIANRERQAVEAEGRSDERAVGRAAARRADAEAAARLLRFVEALERRVAAVDRAVSWADKAAAASQLVESLLGPTHRRLHWPDDEREAADRVDTALARLAVLDDVEPHPSFASFERAVVAELDTSVGRTGRYGGGLVFGPLASAVGQDLDAVFVLGMAEGSCPAPRAEDPLLVDGLRERAVQGELSSRGDELAMQHRSLLAALAAAPAGSAAAPRRFLTFPRGDLRSSRHRIPSRWLLPTASTMAGERISTEAFQSLRAEGLVEVASFAAGLLGDRPRADAAEYDVAEVHSFVVVGGDPSSHPAADGAVARGLDALAGRQASRFTEWDGDLGGSQVELPGTTRPASATRLETWAACPFRYFLGHVLGLRDRDDPDETTEIDARDRGSLLHEVLESFVRWAIEDRSGGPPAPGEAWTEADARQLHELAGEIMDGYDAAGRTGRPLAWKLERARLERELDAWLLADERVRAEHRSTPTEVEMPFGFDGREALALTIDDGRELSFHGMIDRVDRRADGGLVVFDYKSSRAGFYKGLEDDPVEAGRRLQLGLYAEAARERHEPSADVASHYWLMTTKGANETPGYPWDPSRRRRFLDVVTSIVDGIGNGAFPAAPGEYDSFWDSHENCRWCDFDQVCPKDRSDQARATFQDPRASEVLVRLQPPATDEPEPET